MYRSAKDRADKKTQTQAAKVRQILRHEINRLPAEEKNRLYNMVTQTELEAYNKTREKGSNKDWYTKTHPRAKHSRRNQHTERMQYPNKGTGLAAEAEQADHTTLPYRYRNPLTRKEEKPRDLRVRATKFD